MAGGVSLPKAGKSSSAKKPTHAPKITGYVILLTLMACIGGLLFGYDTGVVSSAMLYLPDDKDMKPLKSLWQELIISITPGTAGIGALLAGSSSDKFGRRAVIITASWIFVVGAAVGAAAVNKWMLLGGRVLLGLAIGFASMIVPVFIGEGAPANIRGTLITIYQFMIAFGFVVANVCAAGFAHIDPTKIGWRLMFGAAAIPALVQALGFLGLPETPRQLIRAGRKAEAKKVLTKIYGGDEAWTKYDLEEIEAAQEEETKMAAKNSSLVISRVLQTPHVRRALLLGCSIQMWQQLIGINTILYYTGTIIRSAGVRDKITTIWISAAISSVQALGTILPMRLIERSGRRIITLLSLTGVVLSLLLMAGSFLLIDNDSAKLSKSSAYDGISNDSYTAKHMHHCAGYSNCDHCVTDESCGFCHLKNQSRIGQCLPLDTDYTDDTRSTIGFCNGSLTDEFTMNDNYCATKFTYLPIIVMVIYLTCFSFGMGPMPWVFNAEVYPLWARSTCVSLATFTNWMFNLLISLTFLSLTQAITKYGAFFLYAVISFIGLLVFWKFMPETQGLEIEEVEQKFMTESERRKRKNLVELDDLDENANSNADNDVKHENWT